MMSPVLWSGRTWICCADFPVNILFDIRWDKTSSSHRRPKSGVVLRLLIVCILNHEPSQIRQERLILVRIEHHIFGHLLLLRSRRDWCVLAVRGTELRNEIALVGWWYVAVVRSEACLATADHGASVLLLQIVLVS